MIGRKLSLALLALALAGTGTVARAEPPAASKSAATPKKDKKPGLRGKMPKFSLLGPAWFWKALELPPPSLTPGLWAEYSTEKPHARPVKVRISVIPEPDLPSPDHRVVEIRQTDATGTTTYIKALLAPEGDTKATLLALQFKSGAMPLMNFPLGQGEDSGEVKIESDIQGMTQAVFEFQDKEPLTTSAGTFETRRYKAVGFKGPTPKPRDEDGKEKIRVGPDGKPLSTEVWATTKDEAPLLGIVRFSDGVVTHTLIAQGTGALADLPDIAPTLKATATPDH